MVSNSFYTPRPTAAANKKADTSSWSTAPGTTTSKFSFKYCSCTSPTDTCPGQGTAFHQKRQKKRREE